MKWPPLGMSAIALVVFGASAVSGCSITTLPTQARDAALASVSSLFGKAKVCIHDAMQSYPVGEDLERFAEGLDLCAVPNLLGQSEAEIRSEFTPAGSGNFLTGTRQTGGRGTISAVTVGVGEAVAGVSRDSEIVAACWDVTLDLEEGEVVAYSDGECMPSVLDPFGRLEVLSIADIPQLPAGSSPESETDEWLRYDPDAAMAENERYRERVRLDDGAIARLETYVEPARQALGTLPLPPSTADVEEALRSIGAGFVQTVGGDGAGVGFGAAVEGGCLFGGIGMTGEIQLETGGHILDGGCLILYGH